jgi:hypothetical protein
MTYIKQAIFGYVSLIFKTISEVSSWMVQDIVDTTPYTKLSPVTADGLIKVLLGGINRRVDEFRNR